MSERLPPPDSARVRDTTLRPRELKILPAGTRLVRVHALAGPHPMAWDELRSWGPTRSRFDHQPPPPREHPTRRVAYVTFSRTAVAAALAEYFQDDGGGVQPIDTQRNRPAMTVFELAAPLTLLDLHSGWVTRAGGNQAITSGSRRPAREWARAIYRHHASVQGLAFRSSVWGPGRCAVLWERAERCLPRAPLASRTLDDPYLEGAIAAAADELGTFTV